LQLSLALVDVKVLSLKSETDYINLTFCPKTILEQYFPITHIVKDQALWSNDLCLDIELFGTVGIFLDEEPS